MINRDSVINAPPGQKVHVRDTISVAFVHEALVCVRERGLNPSRLLAEVGIQPALLDMPQARLPSVRYAALWQRIAEQFDDEFFGMDRRPMKRGSFAMMCHAVINCATLEQALERALHFLRLVLDDIEGVLVREGRYCRVALVDVPHPGHPPSPQRAFAYGTFFLIVYGLACWLIGRRIPLVAVDFRCAEPVFSAEWHMLFSPRLAFDRPVTAICFRSAYLDLPNIRNEAELDGFLREAPANLLVKFRSNDGFVTHIRHLLHGIPTNAWPTFDALAAGLGVSPSTLRRRLEEEGQSYRVILDDLRRDIAIELLADTARNMQSIAHELGFAEPSAFHRAFRKWTGSSPGEYRRLSESNATRMSAEEL